MKEHFSGAFMGAQGEHLRPILEALARGEVALELVRQNATKPLMFSRSRPTIAIVGDDTRCSLGPHAFSGARLEPAIRQAGGLAVVPGGPDWIFYGAALVTASFAGKHFVLIECQGHTASAWRKFVEDSGARIPCLIGEVSAHAR